MSLPGLCGQTYVIIHELLHALGLFHEQSRKDRDDYVTIVWENIEEGHKHNFQKYSDVTISHFGVEYDYNSIMHYGEDFFSKDGKPTIVTKPPGIPIGKATNMSTGDITKLNRMYCGE